MENYGSEIGQKMRSAVKAKLLELGTGGDTGYIDDELPDYVMIMVANKRSKEQMIADLNLFLGIQTSLFVTWLHEVLQKLQEVTVPAMSASASATAANIKKRKPGQKDEATSRRDKKTNKKDKKVVDGAKRANEVSSIEREAVANGSTTLVLPPAINSITDVFAEDLLEKAKKTLDLDKNAAAIIKKGKAVGKERASDKNNTEGSGEFDIPTMSEITSTTEGTVGAAGTTGNRQKDLAELADIQRKIHAAKKHLKEIGELRDDDLESNEDYEDGDFLNLRDDGSRGEFNDAGDLVQKTPPKPAVKPKSPIIFDIGISKTSSSDKGISHTPPTSLQMPSAAPSRISRSRIVDHQIDGNGRRPTDANNRQRFDHHGSHHRGGDNRQRHDSPDGSVGSRKRPVHERLGLRCRAPDEELKSRNEISRQTPRLEKELYVPVFRRKENDGHDTNICEDERNHIGQHENRSRRREQRPRRSSSQSNIRTQARLSSQITTTTEMNRRLEHTREEDTRTQSPKQPQQRHRIGSRVIVATSKPLEPSDDDDLMDKPVNSVIKIKPRPPVSPSRQACKNLLMRAVAEAQRSTILAKSVNNKDASLKRKAKNRLAKNDATLHGIKELLIAGRANTKMSVRERLSNRVEEAGISNATVRRTSRTLVVKFEREQSKRSMAAITKTTFANEEDVREWEDAISADDGQGSDVVIEDDEEHNETALLLAPDDEDDDDHEMDGERVDENYLRLRIGNSKPVRQNETTQFVVTMNDDKTSHKYKSRRGHGGRSRSPTTSPIPQVSSSSAAAITISHNSGAEATSTTRNRVPRSSHSLSREPRNVGNMHSRLSLKADTSSQAAGSSTFSPIRTTPPLRRTEHVDVYRKTKDAKKIIINSNSNDTDEEEALHSLKTGNNSTTITTTTGNGFLAAQRRSKALKRQLVQSDNELRSTTPPLPPKMSKTRVETSVEKKPQSTTSPHASPQKRKHTPLRYDTEKSRHDEWNDKESCHPVVLRSHSRSRSRELRRERTPERRAAVKISIRNAEARKYDHIPSLSSMTVESAAVKVVKPKERCKYHPNCTKQFCEFYHPTAPCKSFPNCKYADKCLYSHPKCKYDMSCTNIDCIFSHSGVRNPSQLKPTAPPLSSSVVPVQNYKSITAAALPPAASTTMCKYFPSCTKVGCTFFHPKPCRFGRNCINKHDCSFYHHELQSSSKFKWVASAV